ncbi:Scr1 family TA system antitoxin-like transcriptional regulator [Streptomyces sp. NPDC058657]|uniref:helix-turn-helix domain-containing protein n=1 Tax=unclassified Streptomyces TaxID=2593676 RepID=UPI00365C52F8
MSPRQRQRKNTSAMRMLGKQLARFREAAGHTQQTLADAVRVDVETIASIEQGRRALRADLAQRLDELLDTRGALLVGVENLPDVDQFPRWAEEYMAHEREALALSWYDNQVLPGLLQTAAYAEAVLRNRVPAFDEDEIANLTEGRLARQQILHRKEPPTASFVVWEPVLHLTVCAPADHTTQLRHLRACADLPDLALQILPLTSTKHAGLDGTFTLLETPEHQHLAYIEGQRGSQWVSSPDDASRLARKYAMLRTQALNTEDSKGLLDSLLGEQ